MTHNPANFGFPTLKNQGTLAKVRSVSLVLSLEPARTHIRYLTVKMEWGNKMTAAVHFIVIVYAFFKEQRGTKDITYSYVHSVSAKHLFSAGLRCRTVLSGRHERAAVGTLLLCAGRMQAVLLFLLRYIRRYRCGYRSLGCAFTSRCARRVDAMQTCWGWCASCPG